MKVQGPPPAAQVLTPSADVPWMHRWLTFCRHLWSDDDALAAYRDRIAVNLSAISALLLLPFAIAHLLAGRWMLGSTILLAQAILALNTLALHRGQPPRVAFGPMAVAMIAAVLASILLQGVNGVFWAYPTLFICYFVLTRRTALVLSSLLVLLTPSVVAVSLSPSLAVRVAATLFLTLVMINVVLNVIGELQRAMLLQTITDPLTGAYNRRHLDAQLAQVVAGAGAARSVHTLLAIDIDHFKAVNDRHGHATGDKVLTATVAVLTSRKRQTDMLFRTGGEEFVLLLARTPPSDALVVAEELRQRIEQAPLLPGERITVSIGLSPHRPGLDASGWLRAADAALYEAKHKGRNCVVAAPWPLPA
ncbi:MAG TPA: GGDEF domain-containing protein [Rubrivivax sp.]|nr:GGDEF domain-containing protein [Rubrivivax sp.]